MPDFDLLIRHAVNHPVVGIDNGKIAAFAEGSAREEIDAGGWLLLPGAIDGHVHFNEPGRADWEGIATGSRACAAGGTTTYFDMPLNSTPPVCDAETFAAKRAVAERESFVDFALWGGLIPGRVDQAEALRDCGVIGLKAFMSHSGIDDFPKADPGTLKAGMKAAAALGMLVAVHAEIDHPEYVHGTSVRDYLTSRPVSMELEAIRLAIELAGETGCALHIVHVSSAEGARIIADAARGGKVDVTCETCPHYLALTGEDMERLGPIAKCAPPLRDDAERLALLDCVRAGWIDTIGSDHSPSPMSMKTDPNFSRSGAASRVASICWRCCSISGWKPISSRGSQHPRWRSVSDCRARDASRRGQTLIWCCSIPPGRRKSPPGRCTTGTNTRRISGARCAGKCGRPCLGGGPFAATGRQSASRAGGSSARHKKHRDQARPGAPFVNKVGMAVLSRPIWFRPMARGLQGWPLWCILRGRWKVRLAIFLLR